MSGELRFVCVAGLLACLGPRSGAQPAKFDAAEVTSRALLRVEHRGPTAISVAPGERLTTLFRVLNGSRGSLSLRARVEHPAHWQLVTPEPPYTVAAGATELRVISVAVPRAAAPQQHWLVYEARDGSTNVARDSVRIAITAQPRISVALLEAPSVSAARRTYRATFVARNTGNVPIVARGRVAGPLAHRTSVDSTAWTLAPGEARVIAADMPAGATADLRGPQYLGIDVYSVLDSSVAARAGAVVEFLARGDVPAPRGRVLPATLALRYAPGARESERTAVDFVAQGTLDRDSTSLLHLVARTPGPQSSPLFEQDEYRLTLQSHAFTLRAGDQYFAQSPLTEAGRLTFGAGATLATGRLSTTVFDLTSRWNFDDGRSRGGSVLVRLADSSRIGLHALSHDGDDGGRVLSLAASAMPLAGSRIGVEVGRGWADSGAVAGGLAWDALLLRPRWQLGFTGHTTDPAYPARNGYGDHHDASASAAVTSALRLRVSSTGREFQRSAAGIVHGLDTQLRSYALHVSSLGSIEWREQDLASRLGTATLDESERAARLLLHGARRAMHVSTVLERGSVTTNPQNVRRDFARASVRSGVRSAAASFALFADYTGRKATETAAAEGWLSAGVVSGLWLGRTQLALTALNARDVTFARVRFSMIDARIDRMIRRSSRLSLRYRSLTFGPYTAGRETYMAIEYSTAFAIPLGGRGANGRLLATVVDRETGRGVADAIVSVANQRFLTDDQGRLVLDRLLPGTYPLDVTQAAAAKHPLGTAAVDGPRAVTIRSAATERVELGVARGARLTGRIVLGKRGAGPADTGGVGLPNVLVTVATARDTVRQLSDADGAFSFVGLAAGPWTLSVSQEDAPANHRFTESSRSVTLNPGQVVRVTLTAAAVARGVRWREGGELIDRGRFPPTAK